MKTYLIKVIIKNSKPPVWVRIGVPHGITFAMLSMILNGSYGLKENNRYAFEFFQAKIRLQEEKSGRVFQPDFYYSLQEASSTYIDDYLDSENWFSYLYSEERSFRCEIEEIKEDASEKEYAMPTVIKLSKAAAEKLDEKEILQFYNRFCAVHYGNKADYPGQAELYLRAEKPGHTGLNGMTVPKTESGNIKPSANEHLKTFTDRLSSFIFEKSGINSLREKYKENDLLDEEDKEMVRNRIKAVLSDPDGTGYSAIMQELRDSLRVSYNNDAFFTEGETSLREALISVYDHKELIEIAGEYGIKGRTRMLDARLADLIAEKIADPDNIRRQMLAASDPEIRLLEKLISGGSFDMNDDQEDEASFELMDKEFIFEIDSEDPYGFDYMVPDEIAEGYRKINTPEFKAEHKRLLWLRQCLYYVDRLYCCVPADVFMRLIKRNRLVKIEKEELPGLIGALPEPQRLCIWQDGEIISADALENDLYKRIKRAQGDKDFYIPTDREIRELFDFKYPQSDPAIYRTVRTFCRCFKQDEEEARRIIKWLWNEISFGVDVQDLIQEILDEWELKFSDKDDFADYAQAVMKLNNETRMLNNRGHKPVELSGKVFEKMRRTGKLPTIVPGSSHAAEMLNQAQPEINKMGFSLDFDSNAVDMETAILSADRKVVSRQTRKVYPNDPCPCGSGKKFKHCCGRK